MGIRYPYVSVLIIMDPTNQLDPISIPPHIDHSTAIVQWLKCQVLVQRVRHPGIAARLGFSPVRLVNPTEVLLTNLLCLHLKS